MTVFQDCFGIAHVVIPAITQAQFNATEVGNKADTQFKALIGGACDVETKDVRQDRKSVV